MHEFGDPRLRSDKRLAPFFTKNARPYSVIDLAAHAVDGLLHFRDDLLPTLGVPPALGRYFTIEEDQPGHNHVIILSDELWRRRFAADPNIIGRSVLLSQENYTVVGVMPPGFNFPLNMPTTAKLPSQQMGYWYPLGLDISKLDRADAGYGAVARLQPGVAIEQAQAACG